jgi:hypothetical protein
VSVPTLSINLTNVIPQMVPDLLMCGTLNRNLLVPRYAARPVSGVLDGLSEGWWHSSHARSRRVDRRTHGPS